jgi:hypothetical protein
MQQGVGSFGLATATSDQALQCEVPEPPPEPEPVVEPPPPEPAPRPAPPARDSVAPVLGPLALSHRRFRSAAHRRTAEAASRRAPVGTKLKYTVSEPGVVRFAFLRREPARCAERGAKHHCYRWRRAGSTGHLSPAGAVRLRFRGRVGRHWLRPGHYRVLADAADAAGNRSPKRRLGFEIVR